MAFEVTDAADNASRRSNIEPLILLEIDGVSTIYGARIVSEKVKIGRAGLKIGDFTIGGLIAVSDQKSLITFEGTTTKITQNINPDTGASTSISSMKIAMVDKDEEITKLITPDDTQTPTFDILGRKCKIWLGFDGTAWKQDFIVVFRGVVDEIDSGAGKIIFNIAHPDTKKRSEVFAKAETELTSGVTAGSTSLPVSNAASFLTPVTGPDGLVDSSTIKFYVRINDEIIRYESTTGTTFDSLTRGALGSTAASHASGDSVESFIELSGDAMTLALKLMLSGHNGPYRTGESIKHFGFVPGVGNIANSIFFQGVDVVRDFGLSTGDFITTTGATNGANNVTLRGITEINIVGSNSYIVVDGAALVTESDTSATMDMRSQYDTLGDGLAMDADEVDVAEHLRILRLFLSGFNYQFFIKDTIEGKAFIETEIYGPAGGYGLPRKSQSSVGLHVGPLPGTDIQVLDTSNVVDPSKIRLRRGTGINFQNTVTYRFDEQALNDRFLRVVTTANADSLAQIKVGVKALNVTSRGMRTSLQGDTLAATATSRRLRKYKFGAEYIPQIQVHFRTGFRVEVGDVVLVDMGDLKITDIKEGGTRSGEPRLFQIDNKSIDFKTGRPLLRLVDTNFDKDARFGTISPSSRIKSAASASQFTIETSFSSVFGINEFKKWEHLVQKAVVKIRNADFSTVGTALLASLNGNTVGLGSPLAFTPTAGMIMELANYDEQPDDVKLIYAFLSDGANNFADGEIPYQFF